MTDTVLDFRQVAWQLCASGRFNEAQRLLVGRLTGTPDDVDAWIILAKLYHQQRNHEQAHAAALKATNLSPAHPEALYTLGRIHRSTGDLSAAEECYRRALTTAPDNPDILTSLGVLLRARGATHDAIELYRKAFAVNPNHAEAANNLGNALAALGATAEAGTFHEQGRPVLAVRMAELCNGADELIAAGKPQDALTMLSDALRIAPYDAALCLSVGKLEILLGRSQTGLGYVEDSARLKPDYVEANEIARQICVAGGLYDRAVHYSERMMEISPTEDIALARGLLLPCIQQSRDSIRETRGRYRRGLAQALSSDAPLTGPNSVLDETSFFIASHTGFYLAYHGESNRDLQVDLARTYLKRMPDLSMTAPHCLRSERRPGRLRIGFISRFLRKHSIGATTRGLIDQLSRTLFEVYALRITPAGDDATTQAIRSSADHTIDLPPELTRARDRIAALELDILFFQDIGMEQTSYFLAFSRLAPVQCVSFGHPDTTGIPNVDYFVSNDLYEPAEAQSHYSEQLFLLRDLPTLAYYYKASLPKVPGPRTKFGIAATETLYLCPQTLFKLHPDFDAILQGILLRDPSGVIVLIDYLFSEYGEQLRARFKKTMPAEAHRIRFVPQMTYETFLELLALADVILDTLHFNGMNTSLEAFALGTPVVTLPGEMQRGRHTQAMYRKMGVLDGIAADLENYIDIAIRIGTDREYAQALRKRILASNGALFEDRRVVLEFERFFLEAVDRRVSEAM
jgi:predicted O-linked N-acetylglucosamine transferase (SPINDLY family)